METVGVLSPRGGAALLSAHDAAAGMFAMAYLEAARYPLWKAQLRDGEPVEHQRRALSASGLGPH